MNALLGVLRVVVPLAVAVAAGSFVVGFEVLLARAVGTIGSWRLRASRGAGPPPRWDDAEESAASMPRLDRIVLALAAGIVAVVVVATVAGSRLVVLVGTVVLVGVALWAALAPIELALGGMSSGEVRRRQGGLRDAAAEARLVRDLIETGGALPERWAPVSDGGERSAGNPSERSEPSPGEG